MTINFSNFKLKSELLKIIKEIGYIKPTLIQLKCIPLLLNGYDVLGIAKTGSGKTASYILPILNSININFLQCLVLVPTRELAIQIKDNFILFSKYLKIKILSLYGGQKYNVQLSKLKNNPNIIVSTPGRLIDYIKRKCNLINFNNIKFLVLDEVDEMFCKGFIKDVKFILSNIINKHQTILFSATICNNIKNIIKKFMLFPKEINLLVNKKKNNNIPENIKQYYCLFYSYKDKINFLINFLEVEEFKAVIIFVKTKSYTLKLSNLLQINGYNCSALNGDMNQSLREKNINNLRNGNINILVATDIAARGLDINNVNLVINYDIPMDLKYYVHRIGRTGRANNIGKAILFINKKDIRIIYSLQRKLNIKINKIYPPNKNILLNIRKNKIINFIKFYIKKKNIKNDLFKSILNIILKKYNFINNEKLNLILLNFIYDNFYLKKKLL